MNIVISSYRRSKARKKSRIFMSKRKMVVLVFSFLFHFRPIVDMYVIRDIMVRLGWCRGYHFNVLLLFSLTKLVGGIKQIFAWPIKTNTGEKTDDKSARYYCRFWTDVGNNFSPRWELTTAAVYACTQYWSTVYALFEESRLKFWTRKLTLNRFI